MRSHIDHLEQSGREARMIEGYRGIARGVAADRLGRRQLTDVGPKDFDDFYDRLRSRGLSPSTIQRYHALLRAADESRNRENHVAFRMLAAPGW